MIGIQRNKKGQFIKGGQSYMGFYGKHHSIKTKEKMSRIKTQWYKNHNHPLKGKPAWNRELKGIHLSPKTEFKKGDLRVVGKNNFNWQDGKSFEPYGLEFNNQLKAGIRKRDNYICQISGKTEKELKRKLDVHHIDYDKKNNKRNNLISLSRSCNIKVNFNREYWKNYFLIKLNEYIYANPEL